MKKLFALILVISVFLSACGTPPTVPASSQNTPVSSVLESSSTSSTESSTPESSSEIESSEPENNGPVGIKGSHITDIMLGLEQTGAEIPKPELKASKDQSISAHYCSSSAKNEVLGVTFSYNLSADKDFQLISGTFDVSTDFLVDNTTFLDVAASYLGFCSTMPCDAVSGALEGIARDWVEITLEDIDAAKSGTGVIWDDTKYQLDWTTLDDGQISSIWLTISRVDPNAQNDSPDDSDDEVWGFE